MNIAFDAKRAFTNNTGLGNYARTLIQGLVANKPNNNYYLFSPRKSPSAFLDFINSYNNVSIILPPSNFPTLFHATWRSFVIPNSYRKLDVDIFHGLSNELPLEFCKNKKTKKIVTIHDLIFVRYPKLYNAVDCRIYATKVKKACKSADLVVAISEQTKRDLIEFYHIPEQKIKVAYQSCNPIFFDEPKENELNKFKKEFNLPADFLLYIGTIEERKNLLGLVKAIKQSKFDIPLVIVGNKRDYYKQVMQFVADNNFSDRLIFLENISTQQLMYLYNLAKIYISSSIFEGFGIPIIEALASKVPVIAHKDSCFPEAGGAYTEYTDVLNSELFSATIDKVLEDENLRKQMIEKGSEHVQKFTLNNTSTAMYNLYLELM
ncbi:MAG: glycosyltransferase family 4 protein [Bacteroidota bacterium]